MILHSTTTYDLYNETKMSDCHGRKFFRWVVLVMGGKYFDFDSNMVQISCEPYATSSTMNFEFSNPPPPLLMFSWTCTVFKKSWIFLIDFVGTDFPCWIRSCGYIYVSFGFSSTQFCWALKVGSISPVSFLKRTSEWQEQACRSAVQAAVLNCAIFSLPCQLKLKPQLCARLQFVHRFL